MVINKKSNENLKTMNQLMKSFEIDDKLYKQTVLNALLKNFKRDYIDKPLSSISTDAGTEFKDVFNNYLYNNNIFHKVASTSRHTQQANVESLNRILGKIIMIYLSKKSMETDTEYTDWTNLLPQIRINLNKYRNNQFKI